MGLAGLGLSVVMTGAGAGTYMLLNNGAEAKPTETQQPLNESEVPQKVKDVKPLAKAFIPEFKKHFDGKVYISDEGELVIEYRTNAEKEGELETEFAQIAKLYAETVMEGEYEPVTLSLIVGKVQGIVPEPALRAYVESDINQEAYLKTIEVTDVERNTPSN